MHVNSMVMFSLFLSSAVDDLITFAQVFVCLLTTDSLDNGKPYLPPHTYSMQSSVDIISQLLDSSAYIHKYGKIT